MSHSFLKYGAVLLAGLAGTSLVQAGVSANEAAKLKSELTPFGAERAGNKDGSIPAWTGGLVKPGEVTGRRPDPFADEKPLYSITAKNMAQYADKLSEGSKALFKKYPDTYRIDVYKTHRTAAAPQWVYDNTAQNATQASLGEGGAGPMPKGAYGGIPFPIPKSGYEAVWNHMLRWRGEASHYEFKGYQLTTDGRWITVLESVNDIAMPYYYKDGNATSHANGEYWLARSINSGPPIRAGEGIVGRLQLDESKTQAWVYLTGQRRIRKLPNACCDTPTPFSAGLVSFDEVDNLASRVDRFDWKIIGKQEMVVPYNTNRTANAKSDAAVLGAKHLNPDEVRWELHRVWVIEANLKPGQRHTSPRSRYYLDEDTWTAVLSDRWDASGQLARAGFTFLYAMPDIPATANLTWGTYDLISGSVFVNLMFADQKTSYRVVPRPKDAVFSPDSMAAEGVR